MNHSWQTQVSLRPLMRHGWLLLALASTGLVLIDLRDDTQLMHVADQRTFDRSLASILIAAMLWLNLLSWVAIEFGTLRRLRSDAQRERERVEHDRLLWQAVGHEIRASLQSLSALHHDREDPSTRYVERMRRAIRVLRTGAAPAQAIGCASVQTEALDLERFLQRVADNAEPAGIAQVEFRGVCEPVIVEADEHSLEDAVTHVLMNAHHHREPHSPIRIGLRSDLGVAEIRIHNCGPHIRITPLDRIFEYGVSDPASPASAEHLGQGLFVARTYLSKMGGSIQAGNMADGVEFVLRLPTASGRSPS